MRKLHCCLSVLAITFGLAFPLSVVAAGNEPVRNLEVQVAAPAARQEQRLALVIGNSSYKEAPLANPVNDARAMAQALQSAGFTVLLRTDVDHRTLIDAVREFGTRLRKGGVGVFYFAGHGMQIKGRNYLIPVGADIQREDEVAYSALDAQAVLDKMEAAANGANLMILDACRNNPFTRSFRSSVQGLAQMEAPVGTLVAFSTAPGSVASDGQGGNGLYTQHLLTAMRLPGAKVEDVFKQVRAGVRRDSNGKQIPWEATSLEGDLYFVAPILVQPPPKVDPARELEDAFWTAVKDSLDPTDVRAYLSRYPSGRYETAASSRLVKLSAPAQQPTVTPTKPPQEAAPVATNPPKVDTARELEEAFWTGVKDSSDPADIRAYLSRYPKGQFGALAHARLATLTAPAQQSTVATPSQIAQDDKVLARRPVSVTPTKPAQEAAPVHIKPPTLDSLGASMAAVPIPSVPARPQQNSSPTSNAHGYSIGDKWNFQSVDKYKAEVVKNYVRRVSNVEGLSGITFTDDTEYVSPLDQFLRMLHQPSAFGHTAAVGSATWWGDMKPGQRENLNLVAFQRRDDLRVVSATLSVELARKGVERVRVPAGDFEAIRLDADGQTVYMGTRGNRMLVYWSMRLWYVPELRTFAAVESEARIAGQGGGPIVPPIREREELTSYEFANGAVSAR